MDLTSGVSVQMQTRRHKVAGAVAAGPTMLQPLLVDQKYIKLLVSRPQHANRRRRCVVRPRIFFRNFINVKAEKDSV